VKQVIRILKQSSLSGECFQHIVRTVQEVFHAPVTLFDHAFEIERAFDPSRAQYSSTVILAQLLAMDRGVTAKSIAVVDVDLFIPVLTFVFGEAQLSGPAAVVSSYRLSNEFYGLPRDDDLLSTRVEKEVLHELGHTFGLLHCRDVDCVMRSSTYVEEIDLKHAALCSACQRSIRNDSTIGT
jgi:archaemetzincin